MSFSPTPITPIPTIDAATATPAPAGQASATTSGENVLAASGATVVPPLEGIIRVGASGAGSNIAIAGTGNAIVTISPTVDANGNPVDTSGTAFQGAPNRQGTFAVNLGDAPVSGTKVNPSTVTFGGASIGSLLPGGGATAFATANNLDYYVSTGGVNDEVQGSRGNDYVRTSGGNDIYNLGDGDDIVDLGTGNDIGSLGNGNDILQLSSTDLLANPGFQVKVIRDFDKNGDDKIVIDKELQPFVSVLGLGTTSVLITLPATAISPERITGLISEGETIDADDIQFA